LSLFKGDENFFLEKSSEGVLNPSYCNKPYYARKPLRLQKLPFLNPPPLEGQELFRIVFYPLKEGGVLFRYNIA